MTTFTSTSLPLEKTGSFEKTIISYINGQNSLKKLYDFDPDLSGLRKRVAAGAGNSLDRNLLVEVLKSQYSSLDLSADSPVLSNIELLNSQSTFCVTTGHQLNIFSGPLYVLFKLVSTINLAERLKKEIPEKNFVPVYWMATEDHDIAEINHLSVFSKKFEFVTEYKGKAGAMKLDNIADFNAAIFEVLGDSPLAKEIFQIISDSYNGNKNLASATRDWTHKLLGKYGLVILDADDAGLKKLFVPVAEKELKEQFIIQSVTKATEILKSDFNVQVNPREINLFYIHENTRNRIIKSENSFQVLNTDLKFSESEILNELHEHPERFSPNVLMRPIYQELILPNLAYIGGPSEITYWLELKFIFEKLDMKMPVLMLRNCAMIVERQLLNKWVKLGFQTEDIFRPENELIRMYLDKKEGHFSLQQSSDEISAIFDRITAEVSGIDQSLKATAESEKQKVINSISMLEDKVLRSFKRKEEAEINQIKKIREKFLPGGSLQERSETLLPFYLKWGSNFIEEIKNTFDPLDTRFTIFEEI
ncbi:MAG: bacillithiol biosynthesis cysteine-adding enzyme BshC [Bacteroidota bacterium]